MARAREGRREEGKRKEAQKGRALTDGKEGRESGAKRRA